MKKILERKVYWIAGTFVGLTGVAAVRLIAPGLSGGINTAVLITGYLLSLIGIIIIACSTRDRIMATQNDWREVAKAAKEN